VCGGVSGAANRFYVRRAGAEVEPLPLPGKVSGFPLVRDDVVVMESSGGGGYGDPLARDLGLVAADLAEGVVSREAAAAVYGVAFDGEAIDDPATEARRRALAAARPRGRLAAGDALPDTTIPAAVLDAALAARLAAAPGDILELVDPRGAPLRLWLRQVLSGGTDTVLVARATLAMLGLPAGTEVELRLLATKVLLD
jgi:N-methylhydantoinase B